MTEPCTIVTMPRDRFSTIEKCIESIFDNTPESFDLIVLMGGAPDPVRKRLEKKYGARARLIFKPEFLNGAQMRNMALPLIETRLAVLMDSDVFVRPNWLTPLIQCQAETDASLVVPIILDREDLIHAAGCDFYITQEKGRQFGCMELRYAHQFVGEDTNIKRQEIDFGEIHCQLIVVETAKNLGVYDETLREHHEMDSGLTWKKAGCRMMLEPRSMVYFYLPQFIGVVEDIRYYLWKWDLQAMRDSIGYFREKWNIDVNGRNKFMGYFSSVDKRVGFFSRRHPSRISILLDRALFHSRRLLHGIFGKLVNWVTLDVKH